MLGFSCWEDVRKKADLDLHQLKLFREHACSLGSALGLELPDFDTLRSKALGFVMAGRFSAARDVCAMLLALGDTDPRTPLSLGLAEELLGNVDCAREYFHSSITAAEEELGHDRLDDAVRDYLKSSNTQGDAL